MATQLEVSRLDPHIFFSEDVSNIVKMREDVSPFAKIIITKKATPSCVVQFFMGASQSELDELSAKGMKIENSTTSSNLGPLPENIADFIIKISTLMMAAAGNCNSVGFRIIEHISKQIPSAKFHHDPPPNPNVRPLRGHIGLTSFGGSEMELLATGEMELADIMNHYMGFDSSTSSLPEPERILTTQSSDLTTFWSADYWSNNPYDGYQLHRTHPSKVNIPETERRVSLLWEAKRPPLPGRDLV